MLKNGFYKVAEGGGGVTTCVFYNPETEESISKIVWDIDDIRLDNDSELQPYRYEPIDVNIKKQYLHKKGIIQVGDTVEVYKGRKVPKGTIATIIDIRPYYDNYHRWQADYVYFDNGMKTNKDNCKLIK